MFLDNGSWDTLDLPDACLDLGNIGDAHIDEADVDELEVK